jgi:hypothetical protein
MLWTPLSMTPCNTLYGAEISYYTGKVRAFLQWKGLPFVEVPATGDVYPAGHLAAHRFCRHSRA